MIRDNYILDLNDELIVDNFAGGGGASTGIERALGRHVDHAINHDEFALGMHRINHPQTVHHPEDVFAVNPLRLAAGYSSRHPRNPPDEQIDPRRVRRIGLGWFSPDCKHFSKAKGGKPLSKKIRGLAFVILRWARIRKRGMYPDPEHKGRTWKAFVLGLSTGVPSDHPDLDEMVAVLHDKNDPANCVTRAELIAGFGYEVQFKEIRACDYGTPTIRKRLFLIARCDAMPIVWPEMSHAKVGDGRWQMADGRKLKPWEPVSKCIDWNIPCHSIFLTHAQAKLRKLNVRRPLAKSTMRRIATGVDRYVLKAKKPFLVSLTHQGSDDRVESVDAPANTITGAKRGEKAFIAPSVMRHLNASNQRNVPVDKPMPTQCAEVKGGHFALVGATVVSKHSKDKPVSVDVPVGTASARDSFSIASALMVQKGHLKSNSKMVKGADEPGHAISAGGTHHGVCAAYLAQHNVGFNETVGHEATAPISPISAKGSQQQIVAPNLIAYYGNDKDGQAIDDPARTATVRERFGLVESEVAHGLTEEQLAGAKQVAAFLCEHGVQFDGEFATLVVDGIQYVIVDIGMRMLTACELFRAQGFGNDYIIDRAWLVNPKTGDILEQVLTKEQQIRMCGNSVCPPVAEALVRANSGDLAIWNRKEICRKRTQRNTKTMAASQGDLSSLRSFAAKV